MIQVTKAFLPELEAYVEQLRTAWESGQLTNHGALVERLEAELRDCLGVKHLLLLCNGTVALQVAIRALEMTGEVVTTPFSYVATTSSLVWEGCRPIFADIDPDTLCIDPEQVDRALASGGDRHPSDPRLRQRLRCRRSSRDRPPTRSPSFLRRRPCIRRRLRGRRSLPTEMQSILSFHATKLFHTGEGGASPPTTTRSRTAPLSAQLRPSRPRVLLGPGINGKMSELHAAMGLVSCPTCPRSSRPAAGSPRATIRRSPARPRNPDLASGLERNHAYYPVLFPESGAASGPGAARRR